MAIETWPTISVGPHWDGYEEGLKDDPTLRNDTADGRPDYRDRSYPVIRRFRFAFRFLSKADVDLLRTFQNTTVRIGATAFYFTHPQFDSGDNVLILRMEEPMVFRSDGEGFYRTDLIATEDPNDFDDE